MAGHRGVLSSFESCQSSEEVCPRRARVCWSVIHSPQSLCVELCAGPVAMGWHSSCLLALACVRKVKYIRLFIQLYIRGEHDNETRGQCAPAERGAYGGCPGDSIGFSVRYQGELLGLRDPQNRDLRRKSPPETEKSVG